MSTRADTDLVVTNARIVDGSGRAAYPGELVIGGGVILAVEQPGTVPPDTAVARLDAAGRHVCPGFVDMHSHADNAAFLDADDLTKIRQGVTTEVVGNCGVSLAPGDAGGGFPLDHTGWRSSAELFAMMDERGLVVNACPLVGHGNLRRAVIGSGAAVATDDDLDGMGQLLTDALDAGAFGMSSGLIYPPGVYSTTEELAVLAGRLGRQRLYATHMRDETAGLVGSVEEAVAVGERGGCRVQVSHLKAAGEQNWGLVRTALAYIHEARDRGVEVTNDVYPYVAASTGLSACLPSWVHADGRDAAVARLRDPRALHDLRQQVGRPDTGRPDIVHSSGGFAGVVLASSRSHAHDGRSVLQIAQARGVDPFDAMVELLLEDFDSTVVLFQMTEDDVEDVLRSPTTAIGSDGAPPGLAGVLHPRLYGTFPRVLGRYVRERAVLGLEEAVRRMTALPADVLGLPDRGRIGVGMVADLVCVDAATVDHPGTYADPAAAPVGISWVVQAGHVVVTGGEWAGVRRGRRLRAA